MAATSRERLLAAVITVVAERGYAATSVAETAGRAGVSRSTFYRHFKGKRDCFLTACEAALGDTLDGAERAGSRSPGWASRVRAMLSFLLDRLARDPRMAKACVLELPAAGLEGYEVHDRAVNRLGRMLAPDPAGEAGVGSAGGTDELLAGSVWELIHTTLVRGSASDLPAMLPVLHHLVVRREPGASASEAEDE